MQRVAAEWAGWTVTGVKCLLETVYWTEPVDDQWTWCVECETLVPTVALVEHVCGDHADSLPSHG